MEIEQLLVDEPSAQCGLLLAHEDIEARQPEHAHAVDQRSQNLRASFLHLVLERTDELVGQRVERLSMLEAR